MLTHGTLRTTGLRFKEKLKASDFPPFDGTDDTYSTWARKGNSCFLYGQGDGAIEDLGRVSTFNFTGVTAVWWHGLTQEERDDRTLDWPTLCNSARDSLLTVSWTEKQWVKFHMIQYQQFGHEKETPAQFFSCKVELQHILLPIYPNASAEEHAFEVLDLWNHCPTTWAAHIDTTLCPMAAELIKVAMDKKEQLQASNVTDLSKLVRAELHKQSQRRFANAQLADIADIEEEELEVDSLTADTKPVKAPGMYPYPLVNNRLRKTLLQPCRNCGSVYHYDRNCASWRKLGSSNEKPKLNSKANEAYHKSYVAMTEKNDSDHKALCAAFYSIVDNDTPSEAITVESYTISYEPVIDMALDAMTGKANLEME